MKERQRLQKNKISRKKMQSHDQEDQFGQQQTATFQTGNLNPQTMPTAQVLHLQRTIGNAALQRLIAANQPAERSTSPRVQRTPRRVLAQKPNIVHRAYSNHIQRSFFSRWRRIIGRWLNGKRLPTNTYRWDSRPADVIAQSGFQPWKDDGTITIEEHVNNAFATGAQQGQAAKKFSQWVSTGAYGMLKKLDPTFAQQVLNTNLYKIDTAAASTTGNFNDANDYFDKLGKKRPYATQREWIKSGGVPGAAVVQWMTGKTFLDQYDFHTGAPDEGQLTGWQAMPQPAQDV